jgi:aerobic carbon-monoxide dehydrogenase medium subunit
MMTPNLEPSLMYTHSTDAGWVSRTHRAIKPFRLEKPETIADVLAAFLQTGHTTVIAGGIDLIRRMRDGDSWDTVVDISGVSELKGITSRDDTVRVGALVSHWEIENDPVLAERLPAFQAAWKTIGNVRIRVMGTVGGNLMAAEPGYDGRVVLAAAGGRMIFQAAGGEVSVPAGAGPDDIPSDALLTAIEVPAGGEGRVAFDRSLKPVVSVAVGLDEDIANVAVGCAYRTPCFWSGPVTDIDGSFAATLPEPQDNPMGSAAYRRRMIGVLAQRLVGRLASGDGS